jgi:hypothetical protein
LSAAFLYAQIFIEFAKYRGFEFVEELISLIPQRALGCDFLEHLKSEEVLLAGLELSGLTEDLVGGEVEHNLLHTLCGSGIIGFMEEGGFEGGEGFAVASRCRFLFALVEGVFVIGFALLFALTCFDDSAIFASHKENDGESDEKDCGSDDAVPPSFEDDGFDFLCACARRRAIEKSVGSFFLLKEGLEGRGGACAFGGLGGGKHGGFGKRSVERDARVRGREAFVSFAL